MKKKRCKCGCGCLVKGHPNKKFVNKKHKDSYWNKINPRGMFTPIKTNSFESIGEKIDTIEDEMNPHDPYSLGQE